MAKRTILGMDTNRANLMIAAIEKILDMKLSTKDIILNVVGGFKITEPALDLAILMAICSSLSGQVIPDRIGIVGEVGLTGEIRTIPHLGRRIQEFRKLGFKGCISPDLDEPMTSKDEFNFIALGHISEAVKQLRPTYVQTAS